MVAIAYLVIAAIVGIVAAIGFVGIFNFFGTFFITFIAAFCIGMFIETVDQGCNTGLDSANEVFGLLGIDYGGLWMLLGLPGIVYIVMFLFCGVFMAPFWFLVEDCRTYKTVTKTVQWVAVGILAISTIICVLMFIAPTFLYSLMHWGWLFAILIAASVLVIVALPMVDNNYYSFNTPLYTILLIVAIAIIPATVTGLIVSSNQTHFIGSAFEMNAFGNAPQGKNTVFVLENDIDFEGKEVRWFGEYKNFKGMFNGQGHTLSNFKVTDRVRNLKSEENYKGTGLVITNNGIFRDLKIDGALLSVELPKKYYGTINVGMFAAENQNGKYLNCETTGSGIRVAENETYDTSATNLSFRIGNWYNGVEGISANNNGGRDRFPEEMRNDSTKRWAYVGESE